MTEKHVAPFIPPTIGRVVHYFERGSDGNVTGPLTALVVHVWSDAVVNLAVFSANGLLAQVTSVSLVQGNDDAGPFSRWCEWMPFQKGQAAKAEAEQKPTSWLDRLKLEHEQVAGRTVTLMGFIRSADFTALTPLAQSQLLNQSRFMQGYSAVLGERIASAQS